MSPALLIVRSEPLETVTLAAYQQWYGDHARKLAAVPGVLSARRFESIDGDMGFMAMYELEAPDVTETPAYRAVGRFGAMESHVRFTRNVYREIPLDGGDAGGVC